MDGESFFRRSDACGLTIRVRVVRKMFFGVVWISPYSYIERNVSINNFYSIIGRRVGQTVEGS